MNECFIIAAKRTAIGGFLGKLSDFSATQLGTIAIRAVLSDTHIPPSEIDSVYMGNVLSANLGQSPARQAALGAGLDNETDCTTINKVCSSGLKAVMVGAQQIQLGQGNLVMTGGMESMSNVPHYILKRKTNKLGDALLTDGLLKDGLTDAYHQFHMGNAAELCAKEFGITREQQDEYALSSYARAGMATEQGHFKNEIVPVTIQEHGKDLVFQQDEDVAKINPEKVPRLKPAFDSKGTVTAANASNLNDGATAILLASNHHLVSHNLQPLAKILSYADAAQAPERFTTAPALAIKKALAIAGLTINDIDFFEINEAYAAVILANQKLLDLDIAKVNILGGAIAVGHPLGASGARILNTLLTVLQLKKGKYGIAAICNGGGGASAVVVERI